MADKPIKIPGPDHPISIEPNRSRVVVKVGGKIIADTRDALTLREASYPPVQYIPRRDVDMAALTRSEHTTYWSRWWRSAGKPESTKFIDRYETEGGLQVIASFGWPRCGRNHLSSADRHRSQDKT